MSLVIYNTLTRKKEPFVPVEEGKVKMYVCGPTVYMESHIGHAVGPVIFDTVKRYLTYKGYSVTWVVNITDVDDKIIKRANELGVPTEKLAEETANEYIGHLKKLRVNSIDYMPRVTQHIGEIIRVVSGLVEKGFAYEVDGDVFFEIAKKSDYGKLSNRKVDQLVEGARVEVDERKRAPGDFALWKSAREGEPCWDSPWGKGRPGWHIECSVMSMHYLGETFDIHGGGVDLVFPHHENEIAQSESFTGKPYAKYWMHNGLTHVGSEKMSKSLGNITGLAEAFEKWHPELLRFFLLSTHYRSPLEFNEQRLAEVRKGWEGFYRLFDRVERITGRSVFDRYEKTERAPSTIDEEIIRSVKAFEEAMDDDFNTARAISVLHELARAVNHLANYADNEPDRFSNDDKAAMIEATLSLKNLGSILGLFDEPLRDVATATEGLEEPLIELVVELRNLAREKRQFEIADLARDKLAKMGIILEDGRNGTNWRKQ